MKVKEINAAFSLTKNLGNYESARAEVGMIIELEKMDNYEVLYEAAFDVVKKEVKEQLAKVKYNK